MNLVKGERHSLTKLELAIILIYNEIKKLLRAKNFNWEENNEVHLFELCTWQIVARLGKA